MKHQTVRSGRKSTIYGFPVKLKVNSIEDGYRALALSIVKQALYDLDELNFYKTDFLQQTPECTKPCPALKLKTFCAPVGSASSPAQTVNSRIYF